jgi:hypothetical protein
LFYIHGGLTGLGALFIMTFIKETSHLTDKEKKALYEPRQSRSPSVGSKRNKNSELEY